MSRPTPTPLSPRQPNPMPVPPRACPRPAGRSRATPPLDGSPNPAGAHSPEGRGKPRCRLSRAATPDRSVERLDPSCAARACEPPCSLAAERRRVKQHLITELNGLIVVKAAKAKGSGTALSRSGDFALWRQQPMCPRGGVRPPFGERTRDEGSRWARIRREGRSWVPVPLREATVPVRSTHRAKGPLAELRGWRPTRADFAEDPFPKS